MINRRKCLIWLPVCLVFFFGVFSLNNLIVNDNALDLLPDGAVRGDLQKLQQIGLVDRLFITLSADEKAFPNLVEAGAALKKSAENLGLLLESSDNFSGVLVRISTENRSGFFELLYRYLPVLLDADDLETLAEMISEPEISKTLKKRFVQLNSPAGIGVVSQIQQDPLGFTALLFAKLGYLRSEFSMQVTDGFFMSDDGRNCLVLAESMASLTDSDNALKIEAELEESYKQALLPGVKPHVIGTLPHTLANSKSVKRDLTMLLPIAAVLLFILLAMTLRDIRSVVVLAIPFLAALPAIGLTSWIYGSVSGLSLGFGIVLIGIAVDFSIHLFLALDRGTDCRSHILEQIGRPIFFATMTTVSVFIVLLFSNVASHRQMATLALTGVLLAVYLAWLLIPVIVPERKKNTGPAPSVSERKRYVQMPAARKVIVISWCVVIGSGLFAWPELRYNGDLRVLDAPDEKVLADEEYFTSVWGNKGRQAFVVSSGANIDEALNTNDKVYRFLLQNGFKQLQTIAALLHGPKEQMENRARWIEFWAQHRERFQADFVAAADKFGFSEAAFAPFLSWIGQEPVMLEHRVILESDLRRVAETMIRFPEDADKGGETERFVVLTTVGVDDDKLQLLLDFAETEESISVLANDKWRSQVEKLLKKDIMVLSLAAGSCVMVLVGLQFRRIKTVVAVMAPVLSALSAMALFCWFTGGALNMMHLIMGIMVIGLSVDYGIFVACSSVGGYSSTALFAVSVCAVSSLIGFGVLAFATHPALYSLGVTVLVGIGAAWPTAILVSPLILGEPKEIPE